MGAFYFSTTSAASGALGLVLNQSETLIRVSAGLVFWFCLEAA